MIVLTSSHFGYMGGPLLPDHTLVELGQCSGHTYVMGEAVWELNLDPSLPWQRGTNESSCARAQNLNKVSANQHLLCHERPSNAHIGFVLFVFFFVFSFQLTKKVSLWFNTRSQTY